jgi:hypothetical protein
MNLARTATPMLKYAVYDPTAMPNALFNELAYFLCSNIDTESDTAFLMIGRLVWASRKCLCDTRQYVTVADRTPEQLALIEEACLIITAFLSEPGYIFTNNPTLPQYFGFYPKEITNDHK